ncbi:toprim domain-containing protein [Emticicia fluvialis]|uniref:toprim domain-containing protein n=1 Tax=Emticicia fluvialis TaxID=2974474 RepID=UPI00216584B0|nr:toprim domain-containing protein [Emticicia fluvialis]
MESARVKLSKEHILQKTNTGYDVFKYYILDFKEPKKAFPAVNRSDKHPSANVFQTGTGEFLYKDFADEKAMDCIALVMKLHGLDYSGALQTIWQDLKLGQITQLFEGGGSFDYWSQYVEKEQVAEIFKEYDIESLKSYTTNNGRMVKVQDNSPVFAFKISESCYKLYKPCETDKRYKHQWIGHKPHDYIDIYGFQQLPEHCPTILITEGLKDCVVANANLNSEGIWAVGIDNVSTVIRPELVLQLQNKCDNLILCLDIDDRGIEGSNKKAEALGLRNFILPHTLRDNNGKDISDWFALGLGKDGLLEALDKVLVLPEPSTPNQSSFLGGSLLMGLLEKEKAIADAALNEIVSLPTLFAINGIPAIKKNTINCIQGKQGCHKSRLGEGLMALALSNNGNDEYLGFKKVIGDSITSCYIDSERNISDEFPLAIKSIQSQAGADKGTLHPDFRFTSIKQVCRKQRLEAVKQFLEEIRRSTNKHLFVVLDVLTDCISNFNDVSESMELLDYLGNLCENSDATFLLIIHENPNSDKGRGHLGTELANKASTVLSIGFEKNKSTDDTDLINLKFLKLRSAKRPQKIYLEYNEQAKGLVLASQSLINEVTSERKQKADIGLIAEFLGGYMEVDGKYSQQHLVDKLTAEFSSSVNTIKLRLDEIESQKKEVFYINGNSYTIKKLSDNGKATFYILDQIVGEEIN